MKILNGGITSPAGFTAHGIFCGIKRSGKPDLALIYSTTPAVCAAVFTKNSIKAAPLIVSEKHIRNNNAQAIVVNSGNANCFTGAAGIRHAEKTTAVFGKLLRIPRTDVIVTSTGIIGKPLPVEKITAAAKKLVTGLHTGDTTDVERAILTTDKMTKAVAVEIILNGTKVTIGSCAKGSGMIAPNMATMLAFVTTDAAIQPALLKRALKEACDESFHCITVDGCMSTNDMVVVMANGQAKNKPITKTDTAYKTFSAALTSVCRELAKKIVLDGEGATKFIEVSVKGAKTNTQARTIGLAIANSNLVKTAAYGQDPNWGRVAAAVGSLGIQNITEKNLKITFSPFTEPTITIAVNVHQGNGTAVIYTSDLSLEYVKINGKYN